jgi:hypothetical protein
MQVQTSVVVRLLTDIQVDRKMEEMSDSSEGKSGDDSNGVSSVSSLPIAMDFLTVGPRT